MVNLSDAKTASKASVQKARLGDLLIKNGLITAEQLQKALKRRAQVDLPLGSILISLGFIKTDDLLNFLSDKAGVPSVNLFQVNIDQKLIDMIPLDKMKQYKILPVSIENNQLTVAMTTPHDFMTISDLEFTIGKKIRPAIVPYFMMEAALKLLSRGDQKGLVGKAIEQTAMADKADTPISPQIEKLLLYFIKSGASDMLLTAGVPPSIKLRAEVKRMGTLPLTPQDCEEYARELLSKKDWEKFLSNNELDIAVTYPNLARLRMNFYRQRNSVSISIRLIPDRLPSLAELNLPEWLKGYALKPQGLILISGPAGHGKSTTMNSLVDIINTNRNSNIITLEDPIEYLHKHKKCNVNQREVGRDTASFEQGLRGIFRQAPDVIVIGELRDKESFEIALRAARTGHLVLSTMNAASSTAVIRIIINMFPAHQQGLIQMLLAEALVLSLAQRLIPRVDKTGMAIATERFVNSNRVSKFIREGNIHQIRSLMESGSEEFSPLEISLAQLYKTGVIEFEHGLFHAINPQFYRELTGIKE
jgi:twitching motility protein PilT